MTAPIDESQGSSWRHGAMAWMVRNRVTPNLLMLVFLIGGLLVSANIKQEVFPDFEADIVTVTVSYPNASPEEVENGIILAVESAVRSVDGVKEVNSTASEGSALVSVELVEGTNPKTALDDIQQEIDSIDTFPEDAKDPTVKLATHRRGVLDIELYGDVSDVVLRNIAEEVRDRLLQSPGVTQTDLVGARDHEIQIEIPQAELRRYGLTIANIAETVGNMAVEVPGGSIETKGGDILLRVADRRDWAREFARIPIVGTEAGTIVRLGDIATVRDGLEDTDKSAIFNGMKSIGVEVYRIGDQTPIGVSDATREAMAEIEAELPPGVGYVIRNDMSTVYKQRLELLLKNGFLGLALVLVLLGAFLEFRLAFWVTMGIPTSFLGALLFLPGMDMSINMMSMFAFIIALGIVVDDAIVAGENVYEYRQRGMSFVEAAMRGARDIAVPISFSILTNIVAFIPLYFVPGVMGKIFGIIPVVVITVFSISWIEALFILPAHLAYSHGKPRNPVSRFLVARQERIAALLMVFIERVYKPVLEWCVGARYLVLAVAVALLAVVSAYALSGRMGIVLMPRAESDVATVTAVLPVGSPSERMIAVRDRLLSAADAVIAANGGKERYEGTRAVISSNQVQARIYLSDPDTRPVSTTEVTQLWRKEVGSITGLESLKFQADRGGPGAGSSLTVELSHRDIDVLERASVDLAARMAEFPLVSDIDDGSAAGKKQISFNLRPEGISLGLTGYDIARQIRAAFYGAEALRQQRGNNEVTVLVRLPESERVREYDLEEFMVKTPAGTYVPLRQVADVTWGRAYTTITRRDGRRTVSVTGDVNPISENNKVKNALAADVLPQLAADYPGLSTSFQGRHATMAESMQSLMASFVFAVLAIYILLAIPFRSYVQPIIVMTALPVGIVGATLGHLIMGYSISVVSFMGVVALSGVVINDSLIMIDYANQCRREGDTPLNAIIQAGTRRFRPIMLTTLTTFGGLAPMIFETSRQARFMIPMAISLGFGILFATAIILILIPSLYMVIEDIQALLHEDEDDDAAEEPGDMAPV